MHIPHPHESRGGELSSGVTRCKRFQSVLRSKRGRVYRRADWHLHSCARVHRPYRIDRLLDDTSQRQRPHNASASLSLLATRKSASKWRIAVHDRRSGRWGAALARTDRSGGSPVVIPSCPRAPRPPRLARISSPEHREASRRGLRDTGHRARIGGGCSRRAPMHPCARARAPGLRSRNDGQAGRARTRHRAQGRAVAHSLGALSRSCDGPVGAEPATSASGAAEFQHVRQTTTRPNADGHPPSDKLGCS